jgi:hypothetical protein
LIELPKRLFEDYPAKSSSPLNPLSRSTVMSVQPLFTAARMGDLDLPNRIVMAPLTRMRADNPAHAPTELPERLSTSRKRKPRT